MGLTSRTLLWLFIINLGIALGAGLYEARITIPTWLDTVGASAPQWNATAAQHDDTGRRFWVFVTTVPLTLLTLVNLVAAWRATGEVRFWWLGAALFALGDRALTLGYFIPTMVRLMRAGPSAEATEAAVRWASLNNVRHVLLFLALLAALQAFAKMYAARGTTAARTRAAPVDVTQSAFPRVAGERDAG
ncbi:MAG TPA: hypothetical protein VFK04_06015 [Gemmatimonadaceae bacterium]|jgi:hypothetical protein|nr:hypothetical protein [Gemmatimonadaceae bacterium]